MFSVLFPPLLTSRKDCGSVLNTKLSPCALHTTDMMENRQFISSVKDTYGGTLVNAQVNTHLNWRPRVNIKCAIWDRWTFKQCSVCCLICLQPQAFARVWTRPHVTQNNGGQFRNGYVNGDCFCRLFSQWRNWNFETSKTEDFTWMKPILIPSAQSLGLYLKKHLKAESSS